MPIRHNNNKFLTELEKKTFRSEVEAALEQLPGMERAREEQKRYPADESIDIAIKQTVPSYYQNANCRILSPASDIKARRASPGSGASTWSIQDALSSEATHEWVVKTGKPIIIPVTLQQRRFFGRFGRERNHWLTLHYDPKTNVATVLDSRPRVAGLFYPKAQIKEMVKQGLANNFPDKADTVKLDFKYQAAQKDDTVCGAWVVMNIAGLSGAVTKDNKPTPIEKQAKSFGLFTLFSSAFDSFKKLFNKRKSESLQNQAMQGNTPSEAGASGNSKRSTAVVQSAPKNNSTAEILHNVSNAPVTRKEDPLPKNAEQFEEMSSEDFKQLKEESQKHSANILANLDDRLKHLEGREMTIEKRYEKVRSFLDEHEKSQNENESLDDSGIGEDYESVKGKATDFNFAQNKQVSSSASPSINSDHTQSSRPPSPGNSSS